MDSSVMAAAITDSANRVCEKTQRTNEKSGPKPALS